MNGSESGKRARLGRITVAATALAVLLVVVSSLLLGGSGGIRGAAPGTESGRFTLAATPAGQLYINLTEEVGTGGAQLSSYLRVYVEFNNTTTLHKLPYSNLAAKGSLWVSIVNLTATVNSAPLEQIQYTNVTALNDSGTVKAKTAVTGFEISAGSQEYVNYVAWSYDRYSFAFSAPNRPKTPTAGAEANATLVNYTLTGHAEEWVNLTETFDWGSSLVLFIPDNETFWLQLPATVTESGLSNSPQYGETQTPTWTFSAAVEQSPNSSTLKSSAIHIAAPGSEEWSNYSATYTESNATSSTTGGTFYAYTLGFLGGVVTYWWATVVAVLVAALLIVAVSRRSGRR